VCLLEKDCCGGIPKNKKGPKGKGKNQTTTHNQKTHKKGVILLALNWMDPG